MVGRGETESVLRQMLRDLFKADSKGERVEKLARAHGYADGYMRALMDLEVFSHKELLKIVLDERRRAAEISQVRSIKQISTEQRLTNEAIA